MRINKWTIGLVGGLLTLGLVVGGVYAVGRLATTHDTNNTTHLTQSKRQSTPKQSTMTTSRVNSNADTSTSESSSTATKPTAGGGDKHDVQSNEGGNDDQYQVTTTTPDAYLALTRVIAATKGDQSLPSTPTYLISDLTDGQYQIEVVSQNPQANTVNQAAIFRYALTTGQITRMNQMTGIFEAY
ncbi:hypothetical protein H9L19_02495 [Weissella diestrammenae]|uniref:Uncharacterized protein n=1 Tax=Weissella diestrammenae TaxID=1162633 RepID=A0A7G9T6M7_9LACO|nr:hypothetical protein [Weissella diestrammenae]MCM0582964.1 hypothetical protein [Weissella diestrammenae]QNN75752.1 hypothetical protein H9L19_02495 [Weissella diestrammenae]